MFSPSSSGCTDTRSSSQSHLRNRSSSHFHSFKSNPRLDRPNANTYTPKLNENSPRLPTRLTKFNDIPLGLDVNVGTELGLDYEARKFKSFKFPRADFPSPLSPESPASPLVPITPRTPVSRILSHPEKQILKPNDYLLDTETDRNSSSFDYGHGGNNDDDYANCTYQSNTSPSLHPDPVVPHTFPRVPTFSLLIPPGPLPSPSPMTLVTKKSSTSLPCLRRCHTAVTDPL
jgi:hypothetical protein